MFGTVSTYVLILLSITARSSGRFDYPNEDGTNPAATGRAAKYMVIYPLVYVICTLPLAGGRMAAMTGMVVPYCMSIHRMLRTN